MEHLSTIWIISKSLKKEISCLNNWISEMCTSLENLRRWCLRILEIIKEQLKFWSHQYLDPPVLITSYSTYCCNHQSWRRTLKTFYTSRACSKTTVWTVSGPWSRSTKRQKDWMECTLSNLLWQRSAQLCRELYQQLLTVSISETICGPVCLCYPSVSQDYSKSRSLGTPSQLSSQYWHTKPRLTKEFRRISRLSQWSKNFLLQSLSLRRH